MARVHPDLWRLSHQSVCLICAAFAPIHILIDVSCVSVCTRALVVGISPPSLCTPCHLCSWPSPRRRPLCRWRPLPASLTRCLRVLHRSARPGSPCRSQSRASSTPIHALIGALAGVAALALAVLIVAIVLCCCWRRAAASARSGGGLDVPLTGAGGRA